MPDKIQEAIEELKRIRLELFRSASSLDRVINDLECIKDDPEGPEFIKMFIAERMTCRKDVVRICGWDKLNETENDVWEKLLKNI